MNLLTIVIYLASLTPVIKGFCGVGSAVYAICTWSSFHRDKAYKKYAAITLLLFTLCVAVPGQTTLYLMAGSELGEAAIQSEATQSVIDYITSQQGLQK